MSDDIRMLTQRLADEPSSLAFLELAETLRRRGRLDAAYKVARGGLNRYPGLADAHDLMGRILSDQGDLAGAFDAWADALRFDPMRTGALKGIAFLYFRAGDVSAAIEHLQRAAEADPDDPAVAQAITRVRRDAGEAGKAGFTAVAAPEASADSAPGEPNAEPSPAPEVTHAEAELVGGATAEAGPESGTPVGAAPGGGTPLDSPFLGLEEGGRGLLLADASGQRLAGGVTADGDTAGDRVAAQLAGVTREAARATRLLGLGSWHSIAIEAPDAHLFLSAPTADTVLLAVRERAVPMARLGLLAERAGRAARGWLERVR